MSRTLTLSPMPMRNRWRTPPLAIPAAAALALLAATALPAAAQTLPPPIQDRVVLQLAAEDWVTTETARVVVGVDAAVSATESAGQPVAPASARASLLAAAESLAPKATWRVTDFTRNTDASGIEHWRAEIEGRLPEAALAGLNDRAQKASRPGLQVRVEAVDFTPTLAETEAVRTRLRADLYRRAGAEVETLNQAFPGRKFRIGNVDFLNRGGPAPLPAGVAARMMAAPPPAPAPIGDEAGGVSVDRKVTLTATVTLSADAE